jgi:hypothetical protein
MNLPPFLRPLLLTLALAASAFGQAMQDGVTLWLYDIRNPIPAEQQPITSMPLLNPPGQTPNLYFVYSAPDLSNIDFTGPWTSPYASGSPDLVSYLYGHIWGRIKFPSAGTYEFRLTSRDGSKFYVNNALVIDNDVPGLNSATASLSTLAGSIPFKVNFWHNTGGARVLLEWKPPGAPAFVPVPATSFETEQGQTLVTSPGPKAFYYANGSGGIPGGPGDGQPLAGVHPSFTLGNFRPAGFEPAVGGLDFLPDGRLVVCTWDAKGEVFLLGNLNGPGPVTVSRFATGLGEPLGVRVVNGIIYVAQKREVTKLLDTDGDGIADEYIAVAHGWPASFNYHEFTFNLCYKDNYFWVTTSTPLKSGDTTYLTGTQPGYPVWDGPGSLIRISEAARSWEIVANGLRTPNGMGVGIDGELFGGDNQGDWLSACPINHLRPGQYYGVPQNTTQPVTPTLPNGTPLERNPPALWLPYNRLSNSNTELLSIPTGTYAGQMLMSELTDGGLNRIFMEKIAGQYQGVAFAFTQGLEVGQNRQAWGPDGSLYVGGLGSGGDWNWQGTRFGLQRLTPNGNVTFEMKTVQSRADGFEIELTQPVPAAILANPANYTLQQWYYAATIAYGGSPQGVTSLTVSEALIAADRKRVFIRVPNLLSGRVTYIRLRNFVNDNGVSPWATEAWYTLNNKSPDAGPSFTPVEPPPPPPPPVGVTTIYEAEDAAYSPSTLWTNANTNGEFVSRAGFTGTGYLDYQNATGDYIQWTVTTPHAGIHTIGFRYALGNNNSPRALAVAVNGVTVIASLPFTTTGAGEAGWSNYQTISTTVFLNKGTNTIRTTAISNSGPNMDHLAVTTPIPPPANAIVLYDGTAASVNNWVRDADASPANWQNANGYLQVRHTPAPDDIVTVQKYKDFQLHAEFLAPAGGSGLLAANSGIKLQRRYELQVLNTAAGVPVADLTNTDAGSIYAFRKPDSNASTGPNTWQGYDAYFTAARWSGATKLTNARVTVYWNGVLVHDDIELPDATGASPAEAPGPDGILLQDHPTNASGEVQFRNIWVIPASTFAEQFTNWTASFGLTGANAQPDACPARDGLVNLWKYAAGANPTVAANAPAGSSFVPAMQVVPDQTGNRYLQFTFRRRIDYAERGLYFVVETSPNMTPGSWTPQSASEVGAPIGTGDGLTEMVALRVNAPLPPGTGQMFARVRVEILQ